MLPIIVQANKNMVLAEKCESSFIWVEYDESLEKVCRPMWDSMTKQIKQSFEIWTTPISAPPATSESMNKAKSTIKSVPIVEKNNPKKIQSISKTKPIEKVISKTASPVKSSTEQKIIYRHWWNDPRVQVDLFLNIEISLRIQNHLL